MLVLRSRLLFNLYPMRCHVGTDQGSRVDRPDGLGDAADATCAGHVANFKIEHVDLQCNVEISTFVLPTVGGSSPFGGKVLAWRSLDLAAVARSRLVPEVQCVGQVLMRSTGSSQERCALHRAQGASRGAKKTCDRFQ